VDENFTVKDVSANDSRLNSFASFKEYVKNPRSMQMLIHFLTEEAKRNSYEIQQLDATISAIQRSLKSIKRQRYIPSMVLAAESDYFFSRSGAGSDVTGFTGQPIETRDSQWFVGINASLPLFRGGEIWHSAEQTKIDIMNLEQQKKNLIQLIEVSVRATVRDLALSVANLDLSKQSADFAVKSYEMVQDAYSKGAVSIVELTDAQTNTLNAELAAFNAIYEFYKNLLRTQRAISDFLILKSSAEVTDFLLRFKDYLSQNVKE
jgi:outer membrane protein TolC